MLRFGLQRSRAPAQPSAHRIVTRLGLRVRGIRGVSVAATCVGDVMPAATRDFEVLSSSLLGTRRVCSQTSGLGIYSFCGGVNPKNHKKQA